MITTLAFRHLRVKPLRSLFLLFGFSLGVGVMVVLLSVGEAMLEQSRDVALVGGGEVTVLPEGIDVEAMRSGGVGGMFFGIDRARYLTRVIFGGPRHAPVVRAVAPAIENELVYLATARGDTVAVRVGGEIPSRAGAAGAALDVRAGEWRDSPADSAWVAPTAQQLYDELDRFHIPPRRDSTWGEWHYFNVVAGPGEWWYLSYLVGGEVPDGRWGGQLLVTRRRPDGRYERFTADVPAERVGFDTTRADLTLGGSFVQQRDGEYRLRARARGAAGRLEADLLVRPLPRRYFPPAELRAGDFISGYVVPGLAARATGRLCVGGRCAAVEDAPAYHDHNWGVWRNVTWEWGAASGSSLSLLYGGVYAPDSATSGTPFFLTLVDSMGARQVLRFRGIDYRGSRPAGREAGARAPQRFELVAARDADTVRLRVDVTDVQATRMRAAGLNRYFLQMRGAWRLAGRVADEPVADSGAGFFETFVGREGRPLPPSPALSSCMDTRQVGRHLIDTLGQGWTKADVDLIMSVYSPDAVFIETPFSAPLTGADAIRGYWREVPYHQSEIGFTSGEIYAAGPWFSTEFKCVFRRRRTGEWVDARGAIFCETAGDRISEMRMYWHRWSGGRETGPA